MCWHKLLNLLTPAIKRTIWETQRGLDKQTFFVNLHQTVCNNHQSGSGYGQFGDTQNEIKLKLGTMMAYLLDSILLFSGRTNILFTISSSWLYAISVENISLAMTYLLSGWSAYSPCGCITCSILLKALTHYTQNCDIFTKKNCCEIRYTYITLTSCNVYGRYLQFLHLRE